MDYITLALPLWIVSHYFMYGLHTIVPQGLERRIIIIQYCKIYHTILCYLKKTKCATVTVLYILQYNLMYASTSPYCFFDDSVKIYT